MYLRVDILFAFAVLIGTTSLAKLQRPNIVRDPSVNMLSPAKSMSRIRLAPGYRIELIARAPMVVDPVAMAWDADGALYVVELRSYMLDADATGLTTPPRRSSSWWIPKYRNAAVDRKQPWTFNEFVKLKEN